MGDRRSVVAIESMLGLGVANDLGRHRRACDGPPALLYLLGPDGLVEIAVEAESGRLKPGRQVKQYRQTEAALTHTATVEGHG
jgi:hypothetical protein